jgi:uncharacterized protein YegP (UPF0339 family)
MRKFLVCGLLFGALALFTGVSPNPAVAQKKEMKAGTIEVNKGKDGKFRYSVRNADGKFLAGSTAYATEKEALKGIEELKDVLKTAKVTAKKGGKDGKVGKDGK